MAPVRVHGGMHHVVLRIRRQPVHRVRRDTQAALDILFSRLTLLFLCMRGLAIDCSVDMQEALFSIDEFA